ncbi:MAG: hypothetical protein ACR2HH_04115 [Chthoniobacterales bacterium]
MKKYCLVLLVVGAVLAGDVSCSAQKSPGKPKGSPATKTKPAREQSEKKHKAEPAEIMTRGGFR